VTGTRVPFTSAKTLEFLLEVSPETAKIFLPFNPDDAVSLIVIDGLKEKLPQLGIELVYHEVTGFEDARAAIETLPDDIDAILRIPSPTLDPRSGELSQAAIRRGLPLVAGLPLDEAVFLTCASDFFTSGKQVARLTHLIHHGADPGELPVETTDPFLTINLDTAEKIGVYVPDGILVQAKTIIRR
jgi:putative ABC transport system substrate-binding protein